MEYDLKSKLKLVSLIIPTRNRVFYLSRCLTYLIRFPFGEIIIMDSSDEAKFKQNVITVQSLINSNNIEISHIKCIQGDENNKYGSFKKWGEGVLKAKNKYSIFLTDKSFVIPRTIYDVVNFLENNNEYYAASGKYYSILRDRYNFDHIYLRAGYSNRQSSEENESIKRYIDCLNAGWSQSLLSSICRVDIQKKLYTYFINETPCDLRFGERYIAFLGYLCGKFKYYNNLPYYLIDETNSFSNNKVNYKDSASTRYPQFCDLLSDSITFQDYYSSYRKGIINNLIEYGEVTSEDAVRIFDGEVSKTLTKVSLSYSSIIYSVYIFINQKFPKLINIYHKFSQKISEDIDYNDDLLLIQSYIEDVKKYYNNDEPVNTSSL